MSTILNRMRWRTKIILISLFGVLIIGSSVMIFVNKLRQNYFHHYMTELTKPLSSILLYQIEHNMRHHFPDHFQLFLEEFELSKEVNFIRVLDDSGDVVFSSDTVQVGTRIKIPEAVNDTSLHSASKDAFIYTTIDSPPALKVISGIHNSPRCYKCHGSDKVHLGYFEFQISNQIEKKIERMLILYDFASFIFFMLFFAAIILIGHNYFFQAPFNKIREGIKSIQEGNLDTRIHLNTRGELNQLAQSINAMAEKLKQTRMDLDRAHREQIDRAGQLASIGELAASVAHEIKNPISGIHNALEIILDQNKDLKEKPIFKEIHSQIDRVIKTIHDLMNFARPRTPKFSALEIEKVLQQAVSLYRDQLSKKQISLIESYSPACPTVQGDSELLKQAFVNLLLNAFQACSRKNNAVIQISTEFDEKNGQVRISFFDNGNGISHEQQSKIFKPFYTTKHKGTGLGLSLTQSIIDQHNGTISVLSEPGHWTQFTIELPINQQY
ncbi:MAG: HAMP domain-containing protein [FCB group bacterium]|nr:HAMP domain-containing protein [FCB group bacterium]